MSDRRLNAQNAMMQQLLMQNAMMGGMLQNPMTGGMPAEKAEKQDSSSSSAAPKKKKHKKSKRSNTKTKKNRRADSSSTDTPAEEEEVVTDASKICSNAVTLGFQKKNSYGVAARFDIVQAMLGTKLNLVMHTRISPKTLDELILYLSEAPPDSPMVNWRRFGVQTHGQLKNILLENMKAVGSDRFEKLNADLSNLPDLVAGAWNPDWNKWYKNPGKTGASPGGRLEDGLRAQVGAARLAEKEARQEFAEANHAYRVAAKSSIGSEINK